MRTAFALAIASVAFLLGACGSGPGPQNIGRGPGEACTRDAECEGGLECYGAVCDYTRCEDAPDPAEFCAGRLDVIVGVATCDVGECVIETVDAGGACLADEQCRFGSICEGGICEVTCRADVSCIDPETRCFPRPSDPTGASFCQPIASCDQALSPLAYCADDLDLEPVFVSCVDTECVAIDSCAGSLDPTQFCALSLDAPASQVVCEDEACRELVPAGARGEPCSPDFGCEDGLRCLASDVCDVLGVEGEPCSEDFDCGPGTLCVGEMCLRSCGDGCLESEACFPRPNDALGFCAPVNEEDCSTYPDPDSHCRQQLESMSALCAFGSGMCVDM